MVRMQAIIHLSLKLIGVWNWIGRVSTCISRDLFHLYHVLSSSTTPTQHNRWAIQDDWEGVWMV
jgi:hypothetical protein